MIARFPGVGATPSSLSTPAAARQTRTGRLRHRHGSAFGGGMRIAEHAGDRKNILGFILSREQVKYVQENPTLSVEFKNYLIGE
jgi:hypothetical protein